MDDTIGPRVPLAAIFAAFFLVGGTSFGGGGAGWIHREIVVRRRWIDEGEFLTTLALGQALPAPTRSRPRR